MEREQRIIKGIKLLSQKLDKSNSWVTYNILQYSGVLLRRLEDGKSLSVKKYDEFKEKFLTYGIDLDNLPEEPQEA